jgi:hypothetical protein
MTPSATLSVRFSLADLFDFIQCAEAFSPALARDLSRFRASLFEIAMATSFALDVTTFPTDEQADKAINDIIVETDLIDIFSTP